MPTIHYNENSAKKYSEYSAVKLIIHKIDLSQSLGLQQSCIVKLYRSASQGNVIKRSAICFAKPSSLCIIISVRLTELRLKFKAVKKI